MHTNKSLVLRSWSHLRTGGLLALAAAGYPQVLDDGRVVVDGFAVDGLPHAFAIEGELLHGLLLGEVRPLVEDLPRRLVLEARHVEEALW